ncbi:reverse transcriptase domain-containing protein [Tanacetum coccineum]
MRTRNSNFPNNSTVTIPRRRNRRRAPNVVEPELRTIVEVAPMAEGTMEELLRAPTEGFADALLLMPGFSPTIKSLLMNKEKLLELAKIPLNENFSAMLLKNLPEKLGDPGKFLIPCNFPGMDVCHALADLGASINLMPLSNWKKLSLPELTPTRMTLELVDRSITRPKGVSEDIFVKVGSFHFPTDFVVVDFEADPRVPLILGRSFLRTGRALIDVYEGELILRDGDERLIFHVNKHPQKHANESIKMINFIDFSCEDSFGEVLRLKKSNHFLSGSTTPLSDSSPSLTSFETSDSLLEEFADELALLDPFPPGNEDVDFEAELREIELLLNHDPSTNFSPTIDPNSERFTDEPALACLPPPGDDDDDESFLKEDVQEENFQVYSNPLFEFDDNYNSSDINPLFKEILEDVESKDSNVSNFDEPVLLNTPLFDEDECFDPGGDNDEIDAFLAIEVSTNIEEGYYDSEGDVFYLESLLSDDTTHNLSPEVFFDHEPQHFKNESDHDTLITFSPKSDPLHHEFAGELITLPPRIVREHEEYISRMWEEIDIFPGLDDSIPPGIESDFDSEEDIIFLDNLLNDDISLPEYERFTFDIDPDALVINNFDEINEDECFDPGGGEINAEVDDSFTFFIQTFLPFLTYPEVSPLLPSTESEDTIFDPDIFT